jgi:hypothetical protein
MAPTSGAGKVTLLALWDGKDFSGKPGGTGHMVMIARQEMVDIETIDTRLLLSD